MEGGVVRPGERGNWVEVPWRAASKRGLPASPPLSCPTHPPCVPFSFLPCQADDVGQHMRRYVAELPSTRALDELVQRSKKGAVKVGGGRVGARVGVG